MVIRDPLFVLVSFPHVTRYWISSGTRTSDASEAENRDKLETECDGEDRETCIHVPGTNARSTRRVKVTLPLGEANSAMPIGPTARWVERAGDMVVAGCDGPKQ